MTRSVLPHACPVRPADHAYAVTPAATAADRGHPDPVPVRRVGRVELRRRQRCAAAADVAATDLYRDPDRPVVRRADRDGGPAACSCRACRAVEPLRGRDHSRQPSRLLAPDLACCRVVPQATQLLLAIPLIGCVPVAVDLQPGKHACQPQRNGRRRGLAGGLLRDPRRRAGRPRPQLASSASPIVLLVPGRHASPRRSRRPSLRGWRATTPRADSTGSWSRSPLSAMRTRGSWRRRRTTLASRWRPRRCSSTIASEP